MIFHIYIFRHGETYYNRSRRFTGRINSRLTARGIKQSNVISEKLSKKFIQTAFKTSLSRSSQSLEIVLKHHPECRKVLVDDRMIERSYGSLEGKYHKTVVRKFGIKKFDIWHRSYRTSPPNGESIKKVEERVLSFVKDLIALIEKEKINVAISAHGNSMRPFRRHFENLTVDQMMKLENPYDNYFDYTVES